MGYMNSTKFEYALVSLNDRPLSESEKEILRESISRTTIPIPESYFQGKSDDELLAEALLEDYENLCST